MQAMYILTSHSGASEQVVCENRNCLNDKIYTYYDIRQATDDGWYSKIADKIEGKKASPYNNQHNNEEIYCPKCKDEKGRLNL